MKQLKYACYFAFGLASTPTPTQGIALENAGLYDYTSPARTINISGDTFTALLDAGQAQLSLPSDIGELVEELDAKKATQNFENRALTRNVIYVGCSDIGSGHTRMEDCLNLLERLPDLSPQEAGKIHRLQRRLGF